MAGRTVQRVLAAYKIVRALESPGVLDIMDYETDAPMATGHLDGVADLSPTEDDYRQIFKLAAIIRDGTLHVPWTSADMVFFAKVLRDCPDDGVLTSKDPAVLTAEDWPDDLWGTRLRLGPVDGTFGSLRVIGPIEEIRDKARRASNPDDVIDVMCVPVDPEDRVALTFAKFPLSDR